MNVSYLKTEERQKKTTQSGIGSGKGWLAMYW